METALDQSGEIMADDGQGGDCHWYDMKAKGSKGQGAGQVRVVVNCNSSRDASAAAAVGWATVKTVMTRIEDRGMYEHH